MAVRLLVCLRLVNLRVRMAVGCFHSQAVAEGGYFAYRFSSGMVRVVIRGGRGGTLRRPAADLLLAKQLGEVGALQTEFFRRSRLVPLVSLQRFLDDPPLSASIISGRLKGIFWFSCA